MVDQAADTRLGNCRHGVRYSWSCLRRDWAANDSSISRLVLLVYRLGHLLWVGETPLPIRKVLWPTYRLIDLVWCKLLAGVELDHRACIGPGLRLPHGGRGVVVGLGVTIGADVAIYQYASVGAAEIGRGAWPLPVPIIEDEVRIATGARVLGAIRVGRQALIGANAVVVKDVPPGRTAATDPARIVF